MRRIRHALVAALIAAATIIPAAPAAAVTYTRWLSCPAGTSSTGHIDTASARWDAANARYIAELSGVMDLCRTPTSMEDGYGIARYDISRTSGDLVPFGFEPDQRFSFNDTFEIWPNSQAVCILTSPSTRLACVSIMWSTVDGTLRPEVQGPLPTDDPFVGRTAQIHVPTPPVIGPGCGLCGG